MHIVKTFRSYFLRGMAALLPTILTVWLFVQFYRFIQDNVSIYINRFVVRLLMWLGSSASQEELTQYWVDGKGQIAGFIIVLILVSFIGAVLASVVGRTIWKSLERMLTSIPLVSRVYPYIKQVTDALFNKESTLAFKRVVAIEYPRRGTWSLGLVTGSGLKRVVDRVDEDMVTVFVPSSPTPFTGYVLMVKESETIALTLTIEEALRFTVSGGVITPAQWNRLHDPSKDPLP
jgi:uncharacterized membrane protein